MKKILSLILAVVMVFSIATTAFASVVELKPVEGPVIEPVVLEGLQLTGLNESVLTAGEGGTYYVMLDPTINYKNVTVVASGAVSARMFEYDAKVFAPIPGVTYKVINKYDKEPVEGATGMTYEDADKKATELNTAGKTTVYEVRPEAYINIIEVVVDDNYSASYKEGQIVIKAFNADTEKNESATVKIVRDVVIFGYENVKYYADREDGLNPEKLTGYSDYETAKTGYKDYVNVLYSHNPTVISTTAFKAIRDKDIKVEIAGMEVKIKDVSKDQKGVNFSAYPIKKVDEDKNGFAEKIVFGFNGNQVIASDFEITVDTGFNYYTLREAFGLKIEEDDVVTYTVYRDGKYYTSFDIDYAEGEMNTKVKLIIDGKAGETLGEYSIECGEHFVESPSEKPDVDSSEDIEESNPNTGAPVNFFSWLFSLIFK